MSGDGRGYEPICSWGLGLPSPSGLPTLHPRPGPCWARGLSHAASRSRRRWLSGRRSRPPAAGKPGRRRHKPATRRASGDVSAGTQILYPCHAPIPQSLQLPIPQHSPHPHPPALHAHLHWLGVYADLPPGHRLVWPRPRVGAVELLCCVNVDGVVGTVSLQGGERGSVTPRRVSPSPLPQA